ncbi:SAMP protein, partial [Amia calva]|nr:SAMP protein [Amia calva]
MAEEKELLPWTHVCATWDSVTGIAQLWVNGKGSVRKGVKTSGSIQAKPFILLGQEQDSYGGSFDKGQSFVGQISNVHMWDRVLSPCEIWTIYTGRTSEPSNVLSWKSMQFEIEGYVILENEIVQDLCMSPRNNPHDQIKNIQYGL